MKGPSALLCPWTYYAVKTVLSGRLLLWSDTTRRPIFDIPQQFPYTITFVHLGCDANGPGGLIPRRPTITVPKCPTPFDTMEISLLQNFCLGSFDFHFSTQWRN
jgi:hypothetical protein